MRFWTAIGLITLLSATGLTYEIAAGRVLAPFFGTSLLTWTTVIATVLAGFSLGNAIGGFIAERETRDALRSIRAILIATSVLTALSPSVLALIYSWGARGTGGMFLAVVIAFFPASVLISAPSPLLAKLAVDARPGREGSSLGLVLAAGSLGAILGAVLTGFVALPLVGSAATFAGCAALILLCVPFVRAPAGPDGEAEKGTDIPRIPMVLAGLFIAGTVSLGPVCRYESGLSCIDVTRSGGAVHLHSDRTRQAAESFVHDGPGDRLILSYTLWIWDRMDRDLGPAPIVLFIGGGGYTLPSQLLASREDASAIAVEIDPLITQVVEENLPWASEMIRQEGFDAAAPAQQAGRLGIIHEDGRVYLNETRRQFDAAVMDAFSSASVPAHLVTLETFQAVRRVVDGPVYVNLIDSLDGPLARGTYAILTEIYPYVLSVRGPLNANGTGNVVLAASMKPLNALDTLPDGFERVEITRGRAFTDDRGWVGYR